MPGPAETQGREGKGTRLKLIIVESPAKARTISRFLGPEYEVAASYGHIRDLPGSVQQIEIGDSRVEERLVLRDRHTRLSGRELAICDLRCKVGIGKREVCYQTQWSAASACRPRAGRHAARPGARETSATNPEAARGPALSRAGLRKRPAEVAR